jgi:hypothetical protein
MRPLSLESSAEDRKRLKAMTAGGVRMTERSHGQVVLASAVQLSGAGACGLAWD